MGKNKKKQGNFPRYIRSEDERFPQEKVSSSERVKLINEVINYEFSNPTLLEVALTHHSFYEDKTKVNYQRLEYLGDAVLGLLIAKYHYYKYPNAKPGELTKLRSANVDTEKLARVAFKHELFKFLRHNHPALETQITDFRNALPKHTVHSWGKIKAPKVLADIVESLVGAIYLDSNSSMDTTWMIVKNLLEPTISIENLRSRPRADLDHICQKNALNYEVKDDLWEVTGDVEIILNGECVGSGNSSKNKSTATNIASENAYRHLLSTLSTQIAQNTVNRKQNFRGNNMRSDDKRFPEEKVSSQDRVKLINDIIHYEFNNPSLLEEALIHHSFCEEKSEVSYERLEYIGDAVLGFLMAKHHYYIYPDSNPGELTKLRSTNVDTENLARVAFKCELYKFLRHNHQALEGQINEFRNDLADQSVHSMGLIDPPKVLADIAESLVGAIYLDSNFDLDTTWMIVKNLFEPIITPKNLKSHPVTLLSELCAKNGLEWDYKYLWKDTHEIEEVLVNGDFAGRGNHTNQKIARNRAAQSAYSHLLSKGFSLDSLTANTTTGEL